jgi:hypothetical protein
MISKAYTSFWLCCRTLEKTWDEKQKILLCPYTIIVRPMLIYAAIVWWQRVGMTTVRVVLGRLQRLDCVSITGSVKTASTAALEVLLGLPNSSGGGG